MINPDSEWQEDILIPGVTLYDVQREPRQTKSPGAEVAVPVEQVESELTCPICLSILRDTTIVMECLHRFCNECLKRSMIERMECPSCRQHIPSRRSLRRDLNFDGLIRAIFPDLDLHDRQKQEKATADNNAKHPRLATSTSSTSGGRGGGAAAAAAPTTMTHTPPAAAAPLEAVAPNPAAAGKKRKSSQPEGQGGTSSIAPTMLNFQLHLDPREDRVMPLEKKFLKTEGACTIKHVKRYLNKKCEPPEGLQYELRIRGSAEESGGGNGLVLTEGQKLSEVQRNVWKKPEEMVMLYRLVPKT